MSRLALSLLTLLVLTETVLAADIPIQSRLEAVVVYPAGAEISRTAKIKLEPGAHTLVLSDLPGQVVANSVRVEAKGNARLEIGSVDTRPRVVLSVDAKQALSDRKKLEDERQALVDERALMEATAKAAETQRKLMENLVNLPNNQGHVGGAAQPQTDWTGLFRTIGDRMVEAQKIILGALVTMREINRKIEDVEKRLREVAPKQEQRTEVKVFVSAPAALEGDLVVRYQVAQAGWTPLYDARLFAATKAAAPKLTLTRRAAIRQTSGEDWTEVALTLSTARPSGATSQPVVQPWTVDFYEPPPRPVPVASAPAAPAARMARRDRVEEVDQMQMSGAIEDGKTRALEAVPVQAELQSSPFQSQFAIRDKVTVPTTGEPKQVVADEVTLDPVLTARTAPRLDAKAFLYAKLTMPRTAPYLAGPVSLFRDQTFVGTGRLPQLTPGEEHELGFGADDLVKVRHAVADERKGEQGLISTSRTEAKSYRVMVKSAHERPIQIVVQDALPVSNQQDIKVEIITKPQPTKRDVDDKRGTLVWEDTLKPDEEKTFEYGYKISWPSARQITQRQ